MKQRGMIRYLHMGCGESLAARQLGNLVFEKNTAIRPMQVVQPVAVKNRRKRHEEQR